VYHIFSEVPRAQLPRRGIFEIAYAVFVPTKHNARCITDYINLSLKEQIKSLTNKAVHNFLLPYLQRTLII